jgi:hypothetical protein
MLGVAFVLNTHFYPGLNPYQGRAIAGRLLKEKQIPADHVMIYDFHVHRATLDVYSGMIIPRTWHLDTIDSLVNARGSLYVFTDGKGLDSLQLLNYRVDWAETYKDYQISLLSLPFLNPKTREGVLNELYLMKVSKKED